jgi:ubiquinol-cytochrome c reductase cytochrome b subunit
VMLIPAGLLGLLGAHLFLVVRQKHTQKRTPRAREDNVVGEPLWPNQALTMSSLFAFTAAVLAFLGGVFEINPVWLYGPYEPFEVFAPSQPDWYMGWLEGLVRLWPAWEFTVLGVTIPAVFWPSIVVPGLMFTILFAWPWIEARWVTGDIAEHHINQRPRDVPLRTGVGFGSLAFLLVIWVSGSNDVVAAATSTPLDTLTTWLRVLAVVAPIAVGVVSYRIAARLNAPPEPAATSSRTPAEQT